jgi:hypothetical protein
MIRTTSRAPSTRTIIGYRWQPRGLSCSTPGHRCPRPCGSVTRSSSLTSPGTRTSRRTSSSAIRPWCSPLTSPDALSVSMPGALTSRHIECGGCDLPQRSEQAVTIQEETRFLDYQGRGRSPGRTSRQSGPAWSPCLARSRMPGVGCWVTRSSPSECAIGRKWWRIFASATGRGSCRSHRSWTSKRSIASLCLAAKNGSKLIKLNRDPDRVGEGA